MILCLTEHFSTLPESFLIFLTGLIGTFRETLLWSYFIISRCHLGRFYDKNLIFLASVLCFGIDQSSKFLYAGQKLVCICFYSHITFPIHMHVVFICHFINWVGMSETIGPTRLKYFLFGPVLVMEVCSMELVKLPVQWGI